MSTFYLQVSRCIHCLFWLDGFIVFSCENKSKKIGWRLNQQGALAQQRCSHFIQERLVKREALVRFQSNCGLFIFLHSKLQWLGKGHWGYFTLAAKPKCPHAPSLQTTARSKQTDHMLVLGEAEHSGSTMRSLMVMISITEHDSEQRPCTLRQE